MAHPETMSFHEKIARDREFMQKKQTARAEMAADHKFLYYAGIGSRKTPDYVLTLMTALAEKLREDGMILRSGHAPGADQAFEYGAGGAAHIFLPWATFEQDAGFVASRDDAGNVYEPIIFNDPSGEAWSIGAQYHPAWDNLTQGAQKLHARNAHQILGPLPLSRPTRVEFVLCWTPGAALVGGTATAMRIAEAHEIPIHNLADEDTYDMAFEWAWGD